MEARGERSDSTQRSRAAWLVVAGVLALAGAATWWCAPHQGERRREAPLDSTPPRATPPSRVEPLPEPVVARRVERERGVAFDAQGRGRATITAVDAATGAPLPDAWVALPLPRAPLFDERGDAPDDFDATSAFEIRGYERNPVVVETWWTHLFVVAGRDGFLPATVEADLWPDASDLALRVALARGGSIEVVARNDLDGSSIPGVAMAARLEACDPQLTSLFRQMESRLQIAGPAAPPRVPVFPSPPPSDLARANLQEPPLTLADAIERLKTRPGESWFPESFRGGPQQRFAAAPGGTATFGPLAPGDGWALLFWPSGPFQHRAERPVTVVDGATTRVELRCKPVNLVEGVVRFDDGAPAPDAVLFVASETEQRESDPWVLRLLVDREGRFAIPLDRARLLVIASHDRERDGSDGVGYGDCEFVDFGETAGGQRTVELVLSRAPRNAAGRLEIVRGRVLAPDGRPAAGAWVHAGVYGPIAHTDASGRFVLYGGLHALYHSMAEHDRDARWPEEEFELSVTWELRQGDGRSRELVGHARFLPAAPDPEAELQVRLRE